MSRILFCCRPLSGHFDPLLPLAEAARAAGHSVAVASGEPVAGRASAAGFAAFTVGPSEAFRAEWAPRFPGFTDLTGDAMREFFFTEIFANLELVPRAADLEPVLVSWQPDLVVHEPAELAAPMLCTKAEIPYVDAGYGALIPQSILEAAGTAIAAHWQAHGLDADPLAGMYRYLYIDPCPAALQRPEIAQIGNVQQMRPVDAGGVIGERPAWFGDLSDRPTVYVTLGTIWNTDLDVFRLLIESLCGDANVVVTIGRQNDPQQLGSYPSNVIIRSFIPQHEVLPWCDAAVIHGGAGTMLGALAHGVPLLVIPQGADQWSNAERVVAAGAGLTVLRSDLTAATAAAEVSTLLSDPRYRRAAVNIQEQIAAMPTPGETIVRLEELL
jgi:UDP:flavonoid glycosyltransferase YjiC (YdhE family)